MDSSGMKVGPVDRGPGTRGKLTSSVRRKVMDLPAKLKGRRGKEIFPIGKGFGRHNRGVRM